MAEDHISPTNPAATEPTASETQWTGMASQFPKETREKHKDLLLGEYKDKKAHEVFEELIDMRGKLSRSVVIPDPKTSSPEDVSAFKKTMGIPEEYTFDTKAYEGIAGIEELVKECALKSKARGYTESQAKGYFNDLADFAKMGIDGLAKAKSDHANSFPDRLLEAVGKDQKKADEVTNRLKVFMSKQIGDPELVKAFADSGLLYSPKLAIKLAELSRRFDDAPYVEGQKPGVQKATKGKMGSYSEEFNAEARR